ncbi:hypothetical protein VTN00DRAFT_8907 [Thermoascus crustaceus]|uniref:uncharacterized protein n=1 Tax=Thermoascus crustaceus TaxID=5088 RepID=UPI0037429D57
MSSDFPHGITLERKEGLRTDVGPVNCQLLRLLSKKHNDSLYERTVDFESRRLDTEEAVILKLRYQESTSNYPEKDRPIFVQKATRDF